MGVLKNPKHEIFAQELANGKNATEAYVLAGYSENRGNASTLKQSEIISNRVNELLAKRDEMARKATEKAAERLSIDREWVMAELIEIAQAAKSSEDYAPANKALELLGKELGMFIERKEVGGPGEFAKMSDDELRDFVKGEAEALGFGSSGAKNAANTRVTH